MSTYREGVKDGRLALAIELRGHVRHFETVSGPWLREHLDAILAGPEKVVIPTVETHANYDFDRDE